MGSILDSLSSTLKYDRARQIDDAIIRAINAGLDPAEMRYEMADTDSPAIALLVGGSARFRFQITVDYRRCRPLTQADHADLVRKVVATGSWRVDADGRLVHV